MLIKNYSPQYSWLLEDRKDQKRVEFIIENELKNRSINLSE